MEQDDAFALMDSVAERARREGVIEGLERALRIMDEETWGNHASIDRIRAEIERRKRGEE